MNHSPRRSADRPAFQTTAFRPPGRFQQTPLKSIGSLSPLSPLWLDPCLRSVGLTTEDTEDTEKEGLEDGAGVRRSKPQAICATPARQFRASFIRPDSGAPRMGCCRFPDTPPGGAVPYLTAVRMADGPAGLETCGTAGRNTCAALSGCGNAGLVHGVDARPEFRILSCL